jgi:hypothetical protein
MILQSTLIIQPCLFKLLDNSNVFAGPLKFELSKFRWNIVCTYFCTTLFNIIFIERKEERKEKKHALLFQKKKHLKNK